MRGKLTEILTCDAEIVMQNELYYLQEEKIPHEQAVASDRCAYSRQVGKIPVYLVGNEGFIFSLHFL